MRRIGWRTALVVGLTLAPGVDPALAYDETARAEERADLFAALKSAPNERIAAAAAAAIWEHWQTAPDAKAQAMLDEARRHLRASRLERAMDRLDALVVHAPDYAEGWNSRATTLFLQGKYDDSLTDVEKTLAIEPKHFGALSGKAMILEIQGRRDELPALARKLAEIYPLMNARAE